MDRVFVFALPGYLLASASAGWRRCKKSRPRGPAQARSVLSVVQCEQAPGAFDHRCIDHLPVQLESTIALGRADDLLRPIQLFTGWRQRLVHADDLARVDAQHAGETGISGIVGEAGEALGVGDLGKHGVQWRGEAGQAGVQQQLVAYLVEQARCDRGTRADAQVQAQVEAAEVRRCTPATRAISGNARRPRALSTMGSTGLPTVAALTTCSTLSDLGSSRPTTPR